MMKKWLSRAHFSYSTFVEEEDWYRSFLFSYSFYSEIEKYDVHDSLRSLPIDFCAYNCMVFDRN